MTLPQPLAAGRRLDLPRASLPVLLAIGALLATLLLTSLNARSPSPWPALLAWLVLLAGLLAAAAWLDRQAGQPLALPRLTRREAGFLVLLLAVAAPLRLVDLAAIPANVDGDMAGMATEARTILQGVALDPFATGYLSHPRLFFYLQALGLAAWPDPAAGPRLVSALAGLATLPVLYLFARAAFGALAAGGAALVLAGMHTHLHFSRVGLNNIVDPLLLLAGFGFLLHAVRRGSWFAFAAGGMSLGLAQHFYPGARIVLVLLLAVLIHLLLVHRSRLRASWRGGLLAAAAAILAAGPLLGWFLRRPEEFTARTDAQGVLARGWIPAELAAGRTPWEIAGDQLQRSFGAFGWFPDQAATYSPERPLLELPEAVLAVVGLGIMLTVHRRAPEAWLCLAWILATALIGGALLVNAPEFPRYVTVLPVLALCIALGITGPWNLLVRARPRLAPLRTAGVLLAAGCLAAAGSLFYFGTYAPRAANGWLNTTINNQLASLARAAGPETTIVAYTAPQIELPNPTVRYLAPGAAWQDVPPGQLPPPAPPGQRQLFVFLPSRLAELDAVRAAWPGGLEFTVIQRRDGVALFTVYAPPGAGIAWP